jgi:DNA polymerase I
MNNQKKLFLLDAMALIYRSFFAFQKNPRINSKGFNTGAILGFTNTLWDVLQNQKPTHIGVAFDTSAPTARHEEFESYKANREKMPEELAACIPYIKEIIDAFRIQVLIKPGYEADDIIGTFVKIAEKQGFTSYMMTPDKDYAQLVSENIFMFKPAFMGNEAQIWGVPEILEKFGVKDPIQVIDILGLWGDSADNIPGIPGIGEKRAKELIAEYDSVENVIANADKLKGKMAENVREFAKQGLDSKRLATINLAVPLDFDAEDLRYISPDKEKLQAIFTELEFYTLAKRIFADNTFKSNKPKPPVNQEPDLFTQASLFDEVESSNNNLSNTPHHYKLIETIEEIEQLANQLSTLNAFCFDTETTAIDAQQAELVGIAFSWQKGESVFLYLPDNYDDTLNFLQPLKPIFQNSSILKIGQNLKYDLSVLKWYEIEVSGPIFDTMIAHYLLEPDMKHGMDFLAEKYLNYSAQPIKELIGTGNSAITMREVDKEKVVEYAGEDADITWQLYKFFAPKLKENGVENLFKEVEMPLVAVLTTMETTGIKIDSEALNLFSIELATEVKQLETEIYQLAGHEFNIASPRQLGLVLFEELEIAEKPKMTKTKQYKTGEEILTKLVNKHEIVAPILDYRQLTKLKSTYVDALPKLVNPRTGRVHTSYNQAVASTGRLSSNNPNLQNIPVRTERGREIRKAFVPSSENHVFLAADYSQIELRLIAHFSGDFQMINDFVLGKDIHRATAARVYGIPESEVTKEMRSHAKSVNFGIIYGISAFGLSENLNISRAEAARIINAYFTEYPSVKQFMDSQIQFARQNGYVETILGRRRYLRDINSSNAIVRGFDERNAINAPIQGSSADMIKIAMIHIHNELKNRNLKTKMLLQVHDELVFDVPKEEVEEVRTLVVEKMKNAIQLKVPVEVDSNIGNDWLEAH